MEGRAAAYRIKRECKPSGPRKRCYKPFPIRRDGTERKTLSRTELRARGWSTALIDEQFPARDRDFTVQCISKPGFQKLNIEARYYWVDRVKVAEAEPGFEQQRYDHRYVPKPAKNNPLRGVASPMASDLPQRRLVQKAMCSVSLAQHFDPMESKSA